MLIVALVLAVVGLAALVTAVVTSNELVAWVCIGASALGVLLLVADAIRERQTRRQDGEPGAAGSSDDEAAESAADDSDAEAAEPPVEYEPEQSIETVGDVDPDQITEISGDDQDR